MRVRDQSFKPRALRAARSATVGLLALAMGFGQTVTAVHATEHVPAPAAANDDERKPCRVIRAVRGDTPVLVDERGADRLTNLPVLYEETLLPDFRVSEDKRNACLAYLELGQGAVAGIAPVPSAVVAGGLPLPVIALGAAAIIGGGLAIGLSGGGGSSGTSTTTSTTGTTNQ